jgi:hypothetical protein
VQSLITYPLASGSALVVGTDVGVFVSTNNGASWSALQTGLPRVGVVQLFTDPALTTLFAATHGRGMWKIAIPASTDPTISGVSPSTGPAPGGNSVTITGTGFVAGATVRFGDAVATNVTVTGSTHITLTAPAHAAGAADVTVVNPDGRGVTAVSAYLYVAINPLPPPDPSGAPASGASPLPVPRPAGASQGGPPSPLPNRQP